MGAKVKKQRRSEKLTIEEHKEFISWAESQDTKQQAADKIGIARENLYRLLISGSGKPATILSIRRQLKKSKVA